MRRRARAPAQRIACAARERHASHCAAPDALRGRCRAIVAGRVLLRLIAGSGFANYDTLYALVWGQQLSRGETRQYDLPIAPTPHPLIEVLGVVLAPLGASAIADVTVALGLPRAVGVRLGGLPARRDGSGAPPGALAALILLTRVPVLSYGVRAYIDIPYLLLVLRRCSWRRAGRARGRRCSCCWRSPGCCARRRGRSPGCTGCTCRPASSPRRARRLAPRTHATARHRAQLARAERRCLALLAAAARPLVLGARATCWSPAIALWSLTNTRDTAADARPRDGDRQGARVHPAAHRRDPAPAGARSARRSAACCRCCGCASGRCSGRSRAWSRCSCSPLLAAFGLPIDTRYAFLAAAILCVFCGAGCSAGPRCPRATRAGGGGWPRARWCSWRSSPTRPARCARPTANWANWRASRDPRRPAGARAQPGDHAAVRTGRACPTTRPIPLLALYLKARPAEIVSAQVEPDRPRAPTWTRRAERSRRGLHPRPATTRTVAVSRSRRASPSHSAPTLVARLLPTR